MKKLSLLLVLVISFAGNLLPAQADDYRYWPDYGTFSEHNNWAAKAIHVAEARKLGATGEGIKIAILDDGLVDYGNGLSNKVIAYKDFEIGRAHV